MDRKTPPHNLDAERSVLGGIVLRPGAIAQVAAALRVDDFFLPAHREIFDAMLAVHRRGMTVDVVSLGDELRVRGMIPRLEGGESYLVELAEKTPTAENIGQYVRIVAAKSGMRSLIAACADIQSRAYGDEELGALTAEMSKSIAGLVTGQTEELVRIGDVMQTVIDRIKARAELPEDQKVTGIRFGVDWIDNLTCGGQPGDVIVIAGRPGSGKSAEALQMAYCNAKDGGASCVFSLEMDREENAERSLAQVGAINSHGIRRGELDVDGWKRLYGAAGKLSELDLFLESRPRSFREISAKAHQVRAKCPEKRLLLVIDYLQLIRFEVGKGINLAQAIGEVANGCKELAGLLKATIVLVSSLNRSEKPKRHGDGEQADDPVPTMADLRNSGEIEYAASIILLIHNPRKIEDGDVDWILEKMRNGAPRATGRARWIGRFYRFTNPDDGFQGGDSGN